MSHDGTWRASCRISIPLPPLHFESTFHRTRRDKSRRWLWRLVRPFFIADEACTLCQLRQGRHRSSKVRPFYLSQHRGCGLSRIQPPAIAAGSATPHFVRRAGRERSQNRRETSRGRHIRLGAFHEEASSAPFFCRTSKMSHDRGWRAACIVAIWIP